MPSRVSLATRVRHGGRRLAGLFNHWVPERSRLAVIVAGFLAVLVVIALLIALSLYSMRTTRHSLERLSTHLQDKMAALGDMRENLYLRLVSSRNMLLMTDSFAIDEESQKFQVYANRIGVAYERFRGLAEGPRESELIEKFIAEARQGLPRLDSAVKQLIAGKRPGEILPLLQEAFETQQQALATLQALQQHLQEQSVQLANEAVGRYEQARLIVIVLTVFAVVLVMVIAAIVARLVLQQTEELEQEHHRYKALFEGSRDAVLILRDGRIVECNGRALEWLDRASRGTLAGLTLDDLSAADRGDHKTISGTAMLRQVADQGGGNFEWIFRGQDNRPFYGEVSLSLIPSASDDHLQLVIRDITARMLLLQQMSHEAAHDPLTGLANRREFERRLESAIADARRDPAHQHVVCFMDLDKFKVVNDSAGHAAGDDLLRQFAGLLKSRIRVSDLVARFGGDEFGLLLENCSTERATVIVLDIIQGVDEQRFRYGERVYRVGISVGLAPITAATASMGDLLATADAACYAAKADGSRFRIARPPAPSPAAPSA